MVWLPDSSIAYQLGLQLEQLSEFKRAVFAWRDSVAYEIGARLRALCDRRHALARDAMLRVEALGQYGAALAPVEFDLAAANLPAALADVRVVSACACLSRS
jgi:hypothetical protein